VHDVCTFVPGEAVIAQQVDAVGRSDIEVNVLQIQQSCKPYASFHIPCLHTPSINPISNVLVTCQLGET